MSHLSVRYAPHIAIMVGLVLIPVAIHDYAGVRAEDCANPNVLISASYAERQPPERQRFMERAFDADQWREGRIPRAPLSYSIIRSWNAKRLYYRPAHRIVPAVKPSGESLRWFERDGQRIPIHVVEYPQRSLAGNRSFAAYALMYESKPVSNPYWAQLLAAPLQLVRGAKPMTLYIAYGSVPSTQYEAVEKLGIDWILDSLDLYRTVCAS